MEIAHVEDVANARGTQIGLAYELRWKLENGELLDLEIPGGRDARIALEGRDFFDVAYSPFFNSLPVLRDGLLEQGQARDYTMAFVTVPELEVLEVRQRYEPLGDRIVRFSSGDFRRDIHFDADGLVTLYEGFLERLT